jgi:hypothetical protein
MADRNVRFVKVALQATYDAIVTKDARALYWIEETKRLYCGSTLYGTGAEASAAAAGLLSAEDYAALQELIAAGPASKALTPVDGSIVIADNKIGVGISAAKGNLIKVVDDGIFAAVDEIKIDQVYGLEGRLAAIEKAAVGGIHYRGSVPTKDDLPTDAQQGDLYECIDTGVEYCWNGTEWFEYGSAHFVPVTGAGIDINGSTIAVKLSAIEGNSLVIAEDNGLFVPKCDFTDEDRVVLDTLPMLYVTNNEMQNAISRAIESNSMAWEDLDGATGVAKIGNTYYSTVAAAIAAANAGDTVKIMAGTYSGVEFTDKTKANITLLGEDGVYVGKVRLVDTANYGAPDGLTLKNITFNGEGITADNDTINHMSIVDCDFVDGAVIHIGGCVTDGLIIENCEFDATNSAVNAKEKTAVLIQGISKNVVIRGNNIKDAEHNAIQVVGASGSMLIDSNTIAGTGSRAMRITTKDGAVVAIMNNVITNANTNPAEAEENAGEIIKITGAVVDGAMANNTYNGNDLVFNAGIGQVI